MYFYHIFDHVLHDEVSPERIAGLTFGVFGFQIYQRGLALIDITLQIMDICHYHS